MASNLFTLASKYQSICKSQFSQILLYRQCKLENILLTVVTVKQISTAAPPIVDTHKQLLDSKLTRNLVSPCINIA